MKKVSQILLLVFTSIQVVQAQFNYTETLQKYWNYRYHLTGDYNLKKQYMTWTNNYRYKLGEPGMMVVGSEAGNSIPAYVISLYDIEGHNTGCDLNHWEVCIDMDASLPLTQMAALCNQQPGTFPPNIFKQGTFCENVFRDHAIELEDKSGLVHFDDQAPNVLGEYIMVLSTEWRLLHNNGQSTTNTEMELNYALDAINRMDAFSAVIYNGNEPTALNGLFYRSDVPWDMALGDNFGPNELVSSAAACYNYVDDCTDGGDYSAHANLMMSADNAIYILSSLAWVTEMLADYGFAADLRQKSKEIAKRICYYVRDGNVTDPWNRDFGKWQVEYPSGDPVCKGRWAISWSYIMARATKRITGESDPYAFQNVQSLNLGKLLWDWYYKPLAYAANPNQGYSNPSRGGNFSKATAPAIAANLWKTRYGPGHVAVKLLRDANFDPRGEPTIHYDLMSAVLNGLPVYESKTLYEFLLSNLINFPCQSDAKPDQWGGYNANNELGFMLLFNLYCLTWPNYYLDIAHNTKVTYSNLRSRGVGEIFPYSTGNSQIGHAVIGNSNNPIEIQAAEELSLFANLKNGARVDFIAPHVTLYPGFLAEMGSVSLIQNGRMECDAHEFLTDQSNFVVAAKTAEGEDYDEIEDWENLPGNLNEIINSGILQFLDSTERHDMMKYWTDYFKEHGEANSSGNLTSLNNPFSSDGLYNLIAYPNPFTNSCTVSIRLPQSEYVTVMLTDMLGSINIILCDNSFLEAGVHEHKVERDNLPPGVYVLRYSDKNNHYITQSLIIN